MTRQASGFAQIPPEGGLLRNDTTRKFELGTVISDTYGNSYRYVFAKVALTVGMAVEVAAKAVWDTTINVDGALSAGVSAMHLEAVVTSVAANFYRGCYVSQATDAGLGMGYKIKSHPAFVAAADADIYLEDPIQEDFANDVDLLICNPYWVQPIGTALGASAGTELIRGVAVGSIAANSYGFIQVGGHCPAVAVGGTTSAAIIINEPLVAPTTVTTDMAAGSLQGMAGSTETDIMEAAASPLRALYAVGANTAGFTEAFIHGLV